jgi:hypothetical protein
MVYIHQGTSANLRVVVVGPWHSQPIAEHVIDPDAVPSLCEGDALVSLEVEEAA